MKPKNHKGDTAMVDMNKRKATRDGYYAVGICDADIGYDRGIVVYSRVSNKTMLSFENQSNDSHYFDFLAEYKDGIMRELTTGTILEYVDDVGMVNIKTKGTCPGSNDIDHYYFSAPCYIESFPVDAKFVAAQLKLLQESYDVREYKRKLLFKIKSAIKNYDKVSKNSEQVIEEFLTKHGPKNNNDKIEEKFNSETDLLQILKRERKRLGISYYQTAKITGLTHTSISKIENVEEQLSLELFLQYANSLGYNVTLEKRDSVEKEKTSSSKVRSLNKETNNQDEN